MKKPKISHPDLLQPVNPTESSLRRLYREDELNRAKEDVANHRIVPFPKGRYRETTRCVSSHEQSVFAPDGPGQTYHSVVVPFTTEGRDGRREETLTALVDEWSTAIVGLHLCPERFRVEQTPITLLSVAHEKGTLCHYLNIPYKPSQWIEAPLPRVIVGEFPAKVAAQLGISVRLGGSFREAEHPVSKSLRDWYADRLRRYNWRCMTPDEAKPVLGFLAIEWNRRHKPATCLSAAEYDRTPLGMLQRGLADREVEGGSEDFHVLLLRDADARMTRSGLRVSGAGATLVYERDSWGSLYRSWTRFPAGAYYDPRGTSTVWFSTGRELGLTPYLLADRTYAGMTWAEAGEQQHGRRRLEVSHSTKHYLYYRDQAAIQI